MKKELKALLIVLILLLAGMAGYMLLHGNPMSFYFALGDRHTVRAEEVRVSFSDPGVAEVELVNVSERNLRIRLRKTGTGQTRMSVSCEGQPDLLWERELETTGLGLLYDRSNGNFSGWQGTVVCEALFFAAAAVIFLLGYRRDLRTDFFSYATVLKLAAFLFTLTLALLNAGVLLIYFLDPLADDFGSSCARIGEATVNFNLMSSPLLILFTGLLCVSNVQLIRKEGFRSRNLLGIALSAVMLGGVLTGYLLWGAVQKETTGTVVRCLFDVYHTLLALGICLLLSVFITFILTRKHRPAEELDCIVILGCQIRKDGTLYPLIERRVNRAVKYSVRQEERGGKPVVFVPSGGQGANEPMPEAEAMAGWLKEHGIPEERILPETESRTTRENILFSRELIAGRIPDAKCAFATSNYHMFRAGIIAREAGWPIDGMGCRTRWYFWPNALLREFAGLLRDYRFPLLRLTVILSAAAVLLTVFVLR